MEIQMPSIMDLVLALILLVSIAGGIIRGIIKSISWLPGLVLGAYAVKIFTKSLSGIIMSNSVLTPLWSTYISVLVLMAGTYLIVRLVASIFSSFLEDSGLGVIDKILGGLFSFALAVLVLGILVTVIDNVGVLANVKEYLNGSWIISNVIRPFFSGTVGFVQGAL